MYNPGRKKGEAGKTGRAAVPSRRQFKIALDRCDGYPHALRNKAFLTILFGCGLRPCEAAALVIRDVYDIGHDQMLRELVLPESYTKRNKMRVLPLGNELLIKHVINYVHYRRDKDYRYSPRAPLFLSQRGASFSANSLGNLANEILEKRTGIARASAYSGRRFFATTMANNKVDVNTIRVLMGHSSLATTQRYIDSDPIVMAEATKNLI